MKGGGEAVREETTQRRGGGSHCIQYTVNTKSRIPNISVVTSGVHMDTGDPSPTLLLWLG